VGNWTFLTNHAGVLACLAKEPGVRLRDIAARVDITERAAHRIVCELEVEGYLTRHKVGARNFYELHPDRPLRPPADSGLSIGDLLSMLLEHARADTRPSADNDASD
jgi:hypothetical protein